ncbi:unnamed protein product [Lactuca saligna]|uniref:Uncharacterized protein n=1 Tax=Lactuca saligna TaxID=75948 RepID=A0AA36A0U2_LACSI|nr:unnamed protein product [Lactuca saligna]
MTEKVDKLISDTTAFMEDYPSTYNNNTASTNAALQNLVSMSKCWVKLENVEKKVKDLLSEREVMRSCISNVTCLLLDIIKTKDSMITFTVWNHLAEKLHSVFAMLHRLEGVSPQNSDPKQGGERGFGVSRNKLPKALATPLSRNNLRARKN